MGDHTRFSDDRLLDMESDITYVKDNFQEFCHNFKEHEKQEKENYLERVNMNKEIMETLDSLKQSMEKMDSRIESIEQNTADAVTLTKHIKYTGETLDAIQKGGLWLAKWGIIIAAATATYNYIQRVEVKPEPKKAAIITNQQPQKQKEKKPELHQ